MPDLSTAQRFWYVVRRVLTSPLSLALTAAGVVAVLMSGFAAYGYLLACAVVIAQVALVGRAMRDEPYLRRIFLERQEREDTLSDQQVETLLSSMDFETRQRIRYILQLQRELRQESRAGRAESYTRQHLERIASQVGPLVDRAIKIGTRRQELGRYLHVYDERALQSYCANLRQRIGGTSDPVARAQYEQALKARESELQTYRALAQAVGRIDSQLENVEASLASMKAKAIRIKAADVASAASVSEELFHELEMLNTDIDTLDRSVSQALAGEEEQAQQRLEH